MIKEVTHTLECQESQDQDILQNKNEEFKTARTLKSLQAQNPHKVMTARTIQVGEQNGMVVIGAPPGDQDYYE